MHPNTQTYSICPNTKWSCKKVLISKYRGDWASACVCIECVHPKAFIYNAQGPLRACKFCLTYLLLPSLQGGWKLAGLYKL